MPSTVPSLAQSESKAKLFERLNLREDDKRHIALYNLMKEEAVQGRSRLLKSHGSGTASITDSINETATHREILRIYDQACPITKPIYDLGRNTDGAEEENWIVRWLLWHCFRYRDQRNRRFGSYARQQGGDGGSGDEEEDDNDDAPAAGSTSGPSTPTEGGIMYRASRRFWDPVRGVWTMHS